MNVRGLRRAEDGEACAICVSLGVALTLIDAGGVEAAEDFMKHDAGRKGVRAALGNKTPLCPEHYADAEAYWQSKQAGR